MSSLFQTMSLSTITLEDALQLLTLPRVVGEHPDGGEIVASNGKFGPYVKWNDETRRLEAEEQLLTVDVEQAVKLLSEPKRFGRHKAEPAPPLKELGHDPDRPDRRREGQEV